MIDCIFCKISSHEIPSNIVFENENFLAFLDIRPLNPGHTLVIPRKHYRWVWDVPIPGLYFEVVTRIAKATQKVMKTEWIACEIAGMGVHHQSDACTAMGLHLHGRESGRRSRRVSLRPPLRCAQRQLGSRVASNHEG